MRIKELHEQTGDKNPAIEITILIGGFERAIDKLEFCEDCKRFHLTLEGEGKLFPG